MFKSTCRTCSEEVVSQETERAYQHFRQHSDEGHDVTFETGVEQGDAERAGEFGTAQ